jgi:hypothetical protein
MDHGKKNAPRCGKPEVKIVPESGCCPVEMKQTIADAG